MKEPMTLGHESAGVVVAVGAGVSSGFQLGEKVALEVGRACLACRRCLEGRYNICKGMKFAASARTFPHIQGTLQERINHPANLCYKSVISHSHSLFKNIYRVVRLPGSIPLELGAILEPMSVAIHAVKRAQVHLKSRVLIFGAGAIGLLTAAVAKISGAGQVMIADINQERLDFSINHGFASSSYAVPDEYLRRQDAVEQSPPNFENEKSISSAIMEVDNGTGSECEGFDVTFDCTGAPSCVQAGIFVS